MHQRSSRYLQNQRFWLHPAVTAASADAPAAAPHTQVVCLSLRGADGVRRRVVREIGCTDFVPGTPISFDSSVEPGRYVMHAAFCHGSPAGDGATVAAASQCRKPLAGCETATALPFRVIDFSYERAVAAGCASLWRKQQQQQQQQQQASGGSAAPLTPTSRFAAQMCGGFQGASYRLASNWHEHVPPLPFSGRPIRYLEIGALYGANLLSVGQSYGAHPASELHALDPWEDYAAYPEYRGEQADIFAAFTRNVARSPQGAKVRVHRGRSRELLPTLEDGSFDIVYVDGNHGPEFVLEDAVVSFRKLKPGGVMIFDDYGWQGPDAVARGVDAFLHAFHSLADLLGTKNSQVFVHKRREPRRRLGPTIVY